VLEETSRGDLRLVEIQVKVEICSIMTCFFNKSYRWAPHILLIFSSLSRMHFVSHLFAFLEALTKWMLVEAHSSGY
jgi:hypothetical protein